MTNHELWTFTMVLILLGVEALGSS